MAAAATTTSLFVVAALLLAASLAQAASPPGPSGVLKALEALGSKRFAAMLKGVGATEDKFKAATAILLAPTDAAVDKLLERAGMDAAALAARPEMADAIAAYLLLPGYKVGQPPAGAAAGAKQTANANTNKPWQALRTGDVNYRLRLFRDAKTGRAWVQDAQGRNTTLGKRVKVGNVELVSVDAVPLSGGVFTNLQDALAHYPEWREAAAFVARLGNVASNAAPDMTVFVPTNAAFKANAAKLNGMNRLEVQRVFMGHATRPHKLLTPAVKAARVATVLPGRAFELAVLPGEGTLKKPFSAATIPRPRFQLSGAPRVPTAVAVRPINVFVGKGTLTAVDQLLSPDAVPAVIVAAPASKAPAMAMAGRHLLQSAGVPDWADGGGAQSNPATTFAAANTVGALEAASSENNGVGDLQQPDGPNWDSSYVSGWESNGRR